MGPVFIDHRILPFTYDSNDTLLLYSSRERFTFQGNFKSFRFSLSLGFYHTSTQCLFFLSLTSLVTPRILIRRCISIFSHMYRSFSLTPSAHLFQTSLFVPIFTLPVLHNFYTVQPAHTKRFGAAKTVPYIEKNRIREIHL